MSRLMGLSRLYHTPSRGTGSILSPVPQSPTPVHRDLTPILKGRGVTAHTLSYNQSPMGSPAGSLISGFADSTHYWAAEPLIPDVCLVALWSESPKRLGQTQLCESASKAFLSEDCTGQKYLCYMLPQLQQLRCLKLNVPSHSQNEGKIVAGALSIIHCIDACALKDQKMMLIVDTSNKLMAYTGLKQIGEVHISTGGLGSPSSQRFSSQEEVITPRILSSSRAPSDMGESVLEMSVSPVCESQAMLTPMPGVPGMFTSIESCANNSFIVSLMSGMKCVSSIKPAISSAIARHFLCAICASLPKDKAVNLFSSWFVHKHTGLTAAGNETEGELKEVISLLLFIMKQLGWGDQVRLTAEPEEPDTELRITPKKPRMDMAGTDSDWNSLLQSEYHKNDISDLKDFLIATKSGVGSKVSSKGAAVQYLSPDAPLFSQAAHVFTAMHLVLEEIMLSRISDTKMVAVCREALYRIASAFNWKTYVELYGQEDSLLLDIPINCVARIEELKRITLPKSLNLEDCGLSINIWISGILKLSHSKCHPLPFPIIKDCSHTSATVVSCVAVLTSKMKSVSDADKIFGRGWNEKISFGSKLETFLSEEIEGETSCDRLRRLICLLGVTSHHIRLLPNGIALLLLDSLSLAQRNHPALFSTNQLLWRKPGRGFKTVHASEHAKKQAKKDDPALSGMECLDRNLNGVLRSRFNGDLRVNDVINMLNSSKPPQITRSQCAGQTDEAFREAQENDLYDYCLRSTSQPYGRALATLNTIDPMVTETIQIPELVTYGRAPPHDLKIELTHVELPGGGMARAFDWAHFHNGVAAGCMVMCSQNNQMSSTPWILNSMPKQTRGQQPMTPADAGFLLGLGLNGHLSTIGNYNMHVCLVRGEQLSSIALLLGIAASKRTSCDLQVMKMLAAHLPFLFPPTLLQLQIDPLVQTAALVGVGLLYAGSGHETLAEAVLKEMIKTPTADLDPWPERDAYAIACGITIGMLTLGQGPTMQASDGNGKSLTEKLVRCMHGGLKQDWEFEGHLEALSDWLACSGIATGSSLYDVSGVAKVSSSHVKEGDDINVHICSPGATIAIGLMYLKTNNKSVAHELKAPETLALLDSVRPDFLLLRTLSRYLILWDEMIPGRDWVESLVPQVIHKFIRRLICTGNVDENDSPQEQDWWLSLVDVEGIVQAYIYITTGACMALALRFAGSWNEQAFQTILHYCRLLMEDNDTPLKTQLDMAGKATIGTCVNCLIMALGIVMAGSGNVDVLRIVRHCRRHRSVILGSNHASISHSTSLASHIALGMLFMGGGRYSLSTDNLSIAVLICSIYPKFPLHMADNRHHLQVLRHLHVLAAQPRALIPVDFETKKESQTTCILTYSATSHHDKLDVEMEAPFVLPELKLIERVSIIDDDHWPITFSKHEKSWKTLQDMLSHHGELLVRRRSSVKNGGTCQSNKDELWKHCAQNQCLEAYPLILDLNTRVFACPLLNTIVWDVRLLEEYCSYANTVRGPNKITVLNAHWMRAMQIKLHDKLLMETNAASMRKYMNMSIDDQATYANLSPAIIYYTLANRIVWKDISYRESRHMRNFVERTIKSGVSIRALVFLHKLFREITIQ